MADATAEVVRHNVLLELDNRRRVPLAKLARGEDARYLADVHADGTIVLRPAHVMTDIQLRFLANPEVMAQVAASQAAYKADPSRGNRTRGIPARRGA